MSVQYCKKRALVILSASIMIFLLALMPSIMASAFSESNSSYSPSVAANQAASQISPLLTKQKCEDCWAGYGDGNVENGHLLPNGSVSSVSTNFIMPKTSCTSKTAASAFIVAIDGVSYTDFALAYLEVYCVNGHAHYYAEWYDENTNQTSFGYSVFTPSVGDLFSLSVSVSSGYYNFYIVDHHNGQNLGGGGADTGAALGAAACFTDMAHNAKGEVWPQVNFGTVKFSDCKATIDGQTKGIGDFGSSNLVEYICYNSDGTKVLSLPGALTHETDFAVTFKASGP